MEFRLFSKKESRRPVPELSGSEQRIAKIESLQEKIRNAWTNAKNSQIIGPFGRFDYKEIRYRISKALPSQEIN
jgi:hypothetical protein